MNAPLTAEQLLDDVDLTWLWELANEARLQPPALLEAEERHRAAVAALTYRYGAEGQRVVAALEDVTDHRFRLADRYWLRIGLALGAARQWVADVADTDPGQIARRVRSADR